mgnify:CR=1 FL=1
MKRLCYCLVFVFLISLMPAQGNSATAQPEAIVPPEVEQKFTLEYPEVSARWKIADGLYKAMFINPRNNMGYIIVYDENANIIRREKELEKQEYPQVINDYHARKFPGEGFVVWSAVDSAGNIQYYSPRTEETIFFDRNGQALNDHKKGLADSLLSPPR